MEQLRNRFDQHNMLQKKILIGAAIIIGLMILFPPMVVSANMLGENFTEFVGYHFILSGPGEHPLGLTHSGIAWFRLLIQVAVVAGATIFLLGYVKKNPSLMR